MLASIGEMTLDLEQLLRVRFAYAGRFDASGGHLVFVSDLAGVPQELAAMDEAGLRFDYLNVNATPLKTSAEPATAIPQGVVCLIRQQAGRVAQQATAHMPASMSSRLLKESSFPWRWVRSRIPRGSSVTRPATA